MGDPHFLLKKGVGGGKNKQGGQVGGGGGISK